MFQKLRVNCYNYTRDVIKLRCRIEDLGLLLRNIDLLLAVQ